MLSSATKADLSLVVCTKPRYSEIQRRSEFSSSPVRSAVHQLTHVTIFSRDVEVLSVRVVDERDSSDPQQHDSSDGDQQ